MSQTARRPWTVEEFLAWEAEQPQRYEYIDGIVIMMTGASIAHTIIKGNVYQALAGRLSAGPCLPLVDGPKIVAASHSFYPDIIVTCEPVELADDRVAHPAVILEVLSESTADRDRGRKWLGYQQVPSLQQYVMLAQHERSAETFLRAGSAWTYEVVTAEKSLRLPSLQIEVPLSEIYARPGL